jgi:hypothetical protein
MLCNPILEKPGRLPFFLKGKWGVVPAFPAHRHKEINRALSPFFPHVRWSELLCDYTLVKDNIFTGSHSLIQFGQFLKAGH